MAPAACMLIGVGLGGCGEKPTPAVSDEAVAWTDARREAFVAELRGEVDDRLDSTQMILPIDVERSIDEVIVRGADRLAADSASERDVARARERFDQFLIDGLVPVGPLDGPRPDREQFWFKRAMASLRYPFDR